MTIRCVGSAVAVDWCSCGCMQLKLRCADEWEDGTTTERVVGLSIEEWEDLIPSLPRVVTEARKLRENELTAERRKMT